MRRLVLATRFLTVVLALAALLSAPAMAASGHLLVERGPFAFERFRGGSFFKPTVTITVKASAGTQRFRLDGLPAGIRADRTMGVATTAGVVVTLTANAALPYRLGLHKALIRFTDPTRPEAPAVVRVLELRDFGDRVAGRRTFVDRCEGCHLPDGSGNGPLLFAIYGRPAASLRGFDYSDALKGYGQVWGYHNLFRWISDPQALVPGARMGSNVVVGLSWTQKHDLIAYLRQISLQ